MSNACTTPFRDNTSDPREILVVVLHSAMDSNGANGVERVVINR